MYYYKPEMLKFLKESNAIEQVYGKEALADAYKAWAYLAKQPVITPGTILAVHMLLARNINPRIAGKWRECDVWIGGKRKVFLSIQDIEKRIEDICFEVNNPSKATLKKPNKFTQDMHIKFEDVHPFEDFNGRTFRLIYAWQRKKLGLLLNIIHSDWPKKGGETDIYYNWFHTS